jgi:hypothetical protein
MTLPTSCAQQITEVLDCGAGHAVGSIFQEAVESVLTTLGTPYQAVNIRMVTNLPA